MKKVLFLTAVTVIALSSCKKTYKCECTSSNSYSTTVTTRDISKTDKKTAEAVCGDESTVYTENYSAGSGTSAGTTVTTTTTDCSLK